MSGSYTSLEASAYQGNLDNPQCLSGVPAAIAGAGETPGREAISEGVAAGPKPSRGGIEEDAKHRMVVDLTIRYEELHFDAEDAKQKLGSGAFGHVYRALYQGKAVAVKQLRVIQLSEAAVEELKNEAKIMAKTRSNRLVILEGVALAPSHVCLVMELMPKGSLSQLLRNNNAGAGLPLSLKYRIAMDIAQGLSHLHGAGIVHRDVKSENVLLDDRLNAKLGDFGLARTKAEVEQKGYAHKESVLGSTLWMAPEQFPPDSVAPSESTDLYACGVVLWEMSMMGHYRLPFSECYVEGRWDEAQVVRAKQTRGERQEEIPADCPGEWASEMVACWRKPAERPTASILASSLETLFHRAEAHVAEEQEAARRVFQSPGYSKEMEAVRSAEATERLAHEKLEAEIRQLELLEKRRVLEHKKASLLQKVADSAQGEEDKASSRAAVSDRAAAAYTLEGERKRGMEENLLAQEEKLLPEFLRCVVHGEQAKAEALLQAMPQLALRKGPVRDLSGREFKAITGFQYALWALDAHLWRMLLAYLPPAHAAEQWAEWESAGVEYRLKKKYWIKVSTGFLGLGSKEVLEEKEETVQESHFSLLPLLQILRYYLQQVDHWRRKEAWQAMESYWGRQVGEAQRLLPAHIVHEYCHPDRSFLPVPSFKEASLPRRMVPQGAGIDWYRFLSQSREHGECYAMIRYNLAGSARAERGRLLHSAVTVDVDALECLGRVRQQQLVELRAALQSSVRAMEGPKYENSL